MCGFVRIGEVILLYTQGRSYSGYIDWGPGARGGPLRFLCPTRVEQCYKWHMASLHYASVYTRYTTPLYNTTINTKFWDISVI